MSDDDPLNGPGPAAASDDPFAMAGPPPDLEYMMTPEPERSVGPMDVVGRTLHLLVKRPLVLLGLIVANVVVFYGLTFAIGVVAEPLEGLLRELGPRKVTEPLTGFLVMLLAWSLSLILQAPIVGAAIEARTDRRDLVPEFLSRGIESLPTLLATSAAAAAIFVAVIMAAFVGVVVMFKSLAVLGGGLLSLLLSVAGLVTIMWLALRTILGFSLAVPAAVVEQCGGAKALRRSWQLTAGQRYAIGWGMILPVFAVFLAGIFVAMFVPSVVGWFGLLSNLGLLLYATAMGPATYVVYREFIEDCPPERLLDTPPPA